MKTAWINFDSIEARFWFWIPWNIKGEIFSFCDGALWKHFGHMKRMNLKVPLAFMPILWATNLVFFVKRLIIALGASSINNIFCRNLTETSWQAKLYNKPFSFANIKACWELFIYKATHYTQKQAYTVHSRPIKHGKLG